jgi:uncharacterized protein (UPF0332 family)
MTDERQKARLTLAERLLELAEHSSEAEMRSSFSRMYYAVYHVATALLGNMAHGEIPAALEGKEKGLGERFQRLLELRQGADYDPDFVKRRFDGLDNFKVQFQEEMETARSLYEHLLQMDKA